MKYGVSKMASRIGGKPFLLLIYSVKNESPANLQLLMRSIQTCGNI